MNDTEALLAAIAVATPFVTIACIYWPRRWRRRDKFAYHYMQLRAEPFTFGLARLVWRLAAFALLSSPVAAFYYFEVSRELDPASAWTLVLFIAPTFGYGIGAIAYPFARGLLKLRQGDAWPQPIHPVLLRIGLKMITAVLTEARSASLALQRITALRKLSLKMSPEILASHVLYRGALSWTAGFFGLIAAILLSTLLAVVYFAIALFYSIVAWAPFGYSELQLERLNEQVFLVTFGVVFVAGTDVIVWLKQLLLRLKPNSAALAACVVVSLEAVVTFLALVDSPAGDDNAPLTDLQAVLAGAIVGCVLLVVTDFGQALLSLLGALRQTSPEPGTQSAQWQLGARCSAAVVRARDNVRTRALSADAHRAVNDIVDSDDPSVDESESNH